MTSAEGNETMSEKDWLPELDDDDLAILMEALEAWESKDAAGEMFGDVVEMIVTGGGEPRDSRHARIREERRIQRLDRDRAKAQRKERSVLLRAKLLTLRDRRRVDRVIANTSGPSAR